MKNIYGQNIYGPVFSTNPATKEETVSVGKFFRAKRKSSKHVWKDAVTGKSLGRMSLSKMREVLLNNPNF